ncbi:MAG: 50S ribosomal protein L11 methyltransferase [Eubacteriales bacterium]|nr:50S ribosomal protein L11 methyltransferase [Eubacteriales bacterium]
MKWNKYTIKTTTEAVDLLSSALNDLGIEGIEIEDNIQLTKEEAKTMFVDFIPELPPDDGTARVNFYIDADDDDKTIVDKVKAEIEDLRLFCDMGEGTITESETEDKDWINNWKQYWHTFTIGDLYIKPTWEEVTEDMKGHAVLSIDPGTAFGTGSHETTRLVIKQIQKYVKSGDEVLDVGCGSGILSVVALKYGAKHAFGTDLDPNAIVASRENAEQNGITPEELEVIEGNIIDDKSVKDACGYECYDVVCANILADVLEPLSVCIHEHMKHGAYFITSGIINTKEKEVVEAFEKNTELEIVEINHDGEWVNVTARRR